MTGCRAHTGLRFMPPALAIVSLLTLAACGNGSGSGTPQPAEDALQQIAAQADHPVYYLGQQYRDWNVSDAYIDNDSGRIYVIYGTCSAVVDSCAPPFHVMTEVMEPELWSAADGCSRLPPVRGVPAVTFGDALMLLTADSLITLGDDTGDPAAATAAATQLRPVDAPLSTEALPPPEPAALRIVETACGKNPGDIGPTEREQGPAPTGPPQVPDFTVDQLGGGVLRWSAYRGKPVVVVVGDVPDVIQGIQRVTELRAGPRPAVIGLVWKVFGSKDRPATITAIEEEAGAVSVPVGYAAIPRPAVWFFDTAEVDSAESGVIAFVNAEGLLVRHTGTDANSDAIVAGLDDLAP